MAKPILIETRDGPVVAVLRQLRLRAFRFDRLCAAQTGGAAEDDEVDQRVRAQAVGAVYRHARRLADRHQAGNDVIGVAVLLRQHLAVIVRRYAAHVVVNRRKDGDRLAAQVDAGEHLGAFGDSRQSFGQNLRIEMVEMQIDVIGLGAVAAAFANFDRHRARDDIARGEILGVRRVALHEALARSNSSDSRLRRARLR